MIEISYGIDEAQKAVDGWGFNCGPAALTVIMTMTPEEIRPHLFDFEAKRYTNPKLMYDILDSLEIDWKKEQKKDWPEYGLVRIQWEGPWTEDGQPWIARQRQTHWVACSREGENIYIFDVNAICTGGWIHFHEWSTQLVPWLLKKVCPSSYGTWYITHALSIDKFCKWDD